MGYEIERFREYLLSEERSAGTVEKYGDRKSVV